MAESNSIELIVGLGNPGDQYAATRHNVGFWLVEEIARSCRAAWKADGRFKGQCAEGQIGGRKVRLLMPATFMNRSGEAVATLAGFYKIPIESVLVIHDDLDLPAGTIRLKRGGGHGGHNGLRDIHRVMGGNGYGRIRIGIGHPGPGGDVTGYVLGKPPQAERKLIEDGMYEVIREIDAIVSGQWEPVMNRLHQKSL